MQTDEPRDYERDRSRSPRNDRRVDEDARARSASPGARDRMDDRYSNHLRLNPLQHPLTKLTTALRTSPCATAMTSP